MGARLRLTASPFGSDAFPDVCWTANLIATPKREWLIHGRVADELAIVATRCAGPCLSLHGSLRFEPLMPGSRLILSGRYEAPFSFLGTAFDRLIGAQIVRTSLQIFLDELVCSIELQFETFCLGAEMTHAAASIVEGATRSPRSWAAN